MAEEESRVPYEEGDGIEAIKKEGACQLASLVSYPPLF
jgi:hypothetical protein